MGRFLFGKNVIFGVTANFSYPNYEKFDFSVRCGLIGL